MAEKKKSEAKKPKATRKTGVKKVAHFRTKVANGVSLFLGSAVDGRTLQARRFREITYSIASDLGGIDALSETQKQLVRRNAALCVMAELMESDLAQGKDVDATRFATLVNTQQRVSGTLGITRAVLDLTPNLQDYLAAKAAERQRKPHEDDEPDDRGGE